MPKVVKINNVKFLCWSQQEADRFPNVALGRSGRIHTNNLLRKDIRLNSYVNRETMSALDNYAKHENLNIYIKPLENDMFDDLSVSVFDNSTAKIAEFPMKIKDGREGVREFFKELYTKIDSAVKPDRTIEKVKTSDIPPKEGFIGFAKNLRRNYSEWKIEKMREFINKHQRETGIKRTIADVMEELHSSELYK